jgi:hypothetical protein
MSFSLSFLVPRVYETVNTYAQGAVACIWRMDYAAGQLLRYEVEAGIAADCMEFNLIVG